MFRKLREQGDGASGDLAVAAPAQETPTPESTTPVATPVQGDAGKETTPSVREADLQAQIERLNKTVGDQGNQIGDFKKKDAVQTQELTTFRAFNESLKKTPREVLKPLNTAAGMQVTTPAGIDPSVIGDPTADKGTGIATYIQQVVQQAITDGMGPVNSVVETVHEQHLATKYGESWDELAPVRAANMTRIQSNQIPRSELAHIVSEYDRLPQTISDAKMAGREEYRLELEKKAKEHIADPSGQEQGKVPESEQNVNSAASKLESEW